MAAGKCFRLFTAWAYHNEMEDATVPEVKYIYVFQIVSWSDGVMVSTWDSESQDPSSNLGRTFFFFFFFLFIIIIMIFFYSFCFCYFFFFFNSAVCDK